ncbi:MAG: hypothetical protein SNJ82_14445, partial [Gemmataceae bacterium]
MRWIGCVLLTWLLGTVSAQEYRPAPEAIRKVLDVPPAPTVRLVPGGQFVLLAQARGLPPVADLARPYLRLAGLRIDPRNDGPRLPPRYRSFRLVALAGKGKAVDYPFP